MADLVDERETELEETAEVTQETRPEPVDELPEKYRGKSIAEIVRMHQEAEKVVGRQSQEVGELRRVADEYIRAQLESKKEPEAEVDFFVDPEKATRRAIETHPDILEAKRVAQEAKKAAAASKLQAKHSDFGQIIQDPKFVEWVQGSPVRMRLLQDADQKFDIDAADELFSNWKERKSIAKQTVDAEMGSRKESLRTASTGGSSGSADHNSKKIYRRADIIKLMQTDPERYASLHDEILQAYAERRVK